MCIQLLKAYAKNTTASKRITFKIEKCECKLNQHSSYYIGATIWDILPDSINDEDSIDIYKNLLKRMYTLFRPIRTLEFVDSDNYSLLLP